MTARFEVVRSDAPQPWHARIVASNGRVLMSSETYSRKHAAEQVVLSVARILGFDAHDLRWNVEGVEKIMVNRAGNYLGFAPLVEYVDERSKP